MKHLTILFLAFLLFCNLAIARAGMSPGIDPASGVVIDVDSWLDVCPPAGMVPLKVSIHNGDSQSHTWTLNVGNGNGYGSGGSGLITSTDITVEAGRKVETTVYAAVSLQRNAGYNYGNITLNITGYGVTNSYLAGLNVNSSGRNNNTQYIGMSKVLSVKGWSPLKDKFENPKSSGQDTNLVGSEIRMEDAPEDWRGYSALAQLWMDGGEWIAMSEASKTAMLDWVAMGGRVFILTSEANKALLKLSPTINGVVRHGAGEITVSTWSSEKFPLDYVATQINKSNDNGLHKQLNSYDTNWSLSKTVGELKLNTALIFGFIVIFGALVGPVNLFWFAGMGRRQRLFWTTPLISLAASASLMALMMLQDGLGGNGSRTVLALLMPVQKRMIITQEQVSKTGVLLGRGFSKEEPSWMQPLDWRNNNNNGYYNPQDDARHSFTETPTFRSGDWFSSRAIQGQMIQAVRPSRAAIEVKFSTDPTAAPSVLSSIETPLQKVFIKDETGNYWMAEDVGTGEKKLMKASNAQEFTAWFNELVIKNSGPVISSTANRLLNLSGYAFAEGSDASKIAVKSLPAIRWNQERVIFAGPYVKQP